MCASVALTTCLLPISGRSAPAGSLAKGGVRRGSVLRAALAAGGSAGRPGSTGWYNSDLGKASGRGSVAVRSGSGSSTGGGSSGSASGGGGSGGGKDGSGSGSGGAGGGNNGGSSGSGGSSDGGGSGGRGGPLRSPGRTQEQAPPAATQTAAVVGTAWVVYAVSANAFVLAGITVVCSSTALSYLLISETKAVARESEERLAEWARQREARWAEEQRRWDEEDAERDRKFYESLKKAFK